MGAVAITPEHDAADIAHDIRILEGLAKKLRAERFENGALSTDSLKLSFKLDDNTGQPVDCWQYQRADANDLIEEVRVIPSVFQFHLSDRVEQFMLLTNIAVAQHVAVHLPEQALLRRHDTPIERRLVRLHTYPVICILMSYLRLHSSTALSVSDTMLTSLPPPL